ncbi:hypothetical protein RU98_GL000169 [Enterococcus caccae]|nr:hypothetical protein RU98_GL000169 [Enterococcus caccae]
MKNVSKNYYEKENTGFKGLFSPRKKEKKVIKNISLDIPEGQIIGLLGINGAGKTTTIKMLATLLEPTEGRIFLDNIDVIQKPFEAKRKINLISGGERNLYWRLTATENLEYFGNLYGLSSNILRERITNILEIVDLTQAANIPVEKYSKGMKQRLQIARGLINNPKYIFLDEPTLGLDVLIAKELRYYIKKLAQSENKGILLTSHYMNEIEELCDYVYVLENGEIHSQGTPKDIKKNFNAAIKTIITFEIYSNSFLESLKNITSYLSITSTKKQNTFEILSSNSILKELIQIATADEKTSILSIDVIEPTLEDALLSTWGGTND